MILKELVNIYNRGRTEPKELYGLKLCRPTESSIKRINQTLKFELPKSLIYFAQKCMDNGLIASLGEDYENPYHIIQLNKELKKIRRRKIGEKGKWEYVFPRNFIVFTTWCDDDWICFDLDAQNERSGEYEVVHWSPPRYFGKRESEFSKYLVSYLRYNKLIP